MQDRQTCYIGRDEIQRDLDRFLGYYDLECSHQGYRLKGRTPLQGLMDALAATEIPWRGDELIDTDAPFEFWTLSARPYLWS